MIPVSTLNVRSTIYNLVTTITPFDHTEMEHIDFVRQWIESGQEIFRIEKPAVPDTHLVAYFVVISPNRKQVLLTDHKKSGLWLPPGGHIEPGEHPKDAVKREAMEELGMTAQFIHHDPLFLTVTKTVGYIANHTDVSLWYLLKGDPGSEYAYDTEEFNRIQWFGIGEIPFESSDPHMKRFIQKVVMRGICEMSKDAI